MWNSIFLECDEHGPGRFVSDFPDPGVIFDAAHNLRINYNLSAGISVNSQNINLIAREPGL